MILLQCKYFIGTGKCLVTEAGSRLGNITSIYLDSAETCSPVLILCSNGELELRDAARGCSVRRARAGCLCRALRASGRAEGRLLRDAPRLRDRERVPLGTWAGGHEGPSWALPR